MLKAYGVMPGWLASKGVAGDLNYAFFDKHGRAFEYEFFVALGLNDLWQMMRSKERPCEVVMTAGWLELEQVKTPLHAERRPFNVLVTDEATARELLKPTLPDKRPKSA